MQTMNKIIVSALLLPAPILSTAGLRSHLNLQPPLNSNLKTLSGRSPKEEELPPPAHRPAAGPGALAQDHTEPGPRGRAPTCTPRAQQGQR